MKIDLKKNVYEKQSLKSLAKIVCEIKFSITCISVAGANYFDYDTRKTS